MIASQATAHRRKRLLMGAFSVVFCLMLLGTMASAQSWPRCISGCTANDVELVNVTATVRGACTPRGVIEADLWVSLVFNRNKTYCVRFVADVYIDGTLAVADMVSEPFNVFSKGAYPDIYFGSVSLPCGSSLTLENIQVMWSVDKDFKDVSSCAFGSCAPYGPGSKCTGDQYGTIALSLPLTAQDDAAATDEDTPVAIPVLANDLLGRQPTRVTAVDAGAHGSTQILANGMISYLPDPDFYGLDSFSYDVEDSGGARDSARVSVTVHSVNDAPIAFDDAASTEEDEPVRIAILANDVDRDGTLAPSSIRVTSPPLHGTVDVDTSTGVATYVPSSGDCGHDTFSYVVEDNEGLLSNEAAVSVQIRCNESPIAENDVATTDENTAIQIDVAANDRDPDGTLDVTSLRITRSPSSGSVNVHPVSGLITYMPNPLSCSHDTFMYTIADQNGAVSNEAIVTIDVLCDDPPLAIDDVYHVNEGETLRMEAPGVTANDVSSPGDVLRVTLLSGVSHGALALNPDGSFAYTHDGSETTSDQFTYQVSDGKKTSNVAAVAFIVRPVNDPPHALDDQASTLEDTAVEIDVLRNDSDPDGDTLFVDWVGQPQHGSVANGGKTVTYTPNSDFYGTDTFRYGVTDNHGGQASAAVAVTILPDNDPPVAQDDSSSTPEDTPVDIDVLSNDSDVDGDALTIHSTTRPNHGIVANHGSHVTYVPNPNTYGVDTFSYTAADGRGGLSTARVIVTVIAVNDSPEALDDGAATREDTAVDIHVLANDTDVDGDVLIVESVTQPAHGTAVNHGVSVSYVPHLNFHGEDEFAYTASDGRGGRAVATVYVTVSPVNDPPIAQDDVAVTDEDVPAIIDVLANDADPDGDALTVQSVTQPAHGSAVSDGKTITYSPEADFNGMDTFTYAASDGSISATATVTISVRPINDPPVTADDAVSTPEDTSVSTEVLVNDHDPDGDTLFLVSATQPMHGVVEKRGEAVFYTPDRDFHGIDTLTYTVSDSSGATATGTVTITVTPVNDIPVAQDDSASTDEDTLVSIFVLVNDSDPDGDFLIIDSATLPSNGNVINARTSVSYVPNPDFHGIDSFTYTISDNNGGTATATVTVAVAAVNDPPIAQDDSAIVEEDASVAIDVLANDADPDGDALTIQSVTQPANGAVVRDGTAVIYTPESDFHGVDAFTYTVSDSRGGIATASVTLAVTAVNDPPIAQDDSTATEEDVSVSIDVLANDSDPDGDALAVQSVIQPTHGAVSHDGRVIVYTPAPAFHGIDSFTYTVSDGNGATATATVTVAVAAVNDAPIARDDAAATDEDTPVAIDVLANDSDPNGDVLRIQSVTQPAHGSVVKDGTTVVYTPASGFHGIDSFTYTVSDGNGARATATATIAIAPVNHPPVAQDDSAATDEDVAVTINVLANDSDPDGDPLVIHSVTEPGHGTLVNDAWAVIYTPNPDFYGVDAFNYTASDSHGGLTTATVTVAVAAVNDPPIAQDDETTTLEDHAAVIDVLANDSDPDGDAIAIESITQPAHGTAVSASMSILYTPRPDYAGTDSFTYTVADRRGGRATARVAVNVLPVNDPPVAQDDVATTQEGSDVTVPVLSNDRDPDGDALRVESVTQPLHGRVINNSLTVVYQSQAGFSGTDTFTYIVSDGRGGTSSARVTVLVRAVNHPPIAQADSARTDEGTLVYLPVLANDSDPDGDFLIVESFTQPVNGTVLNSRTSLSYIPNPGFHGVDMFSYTVSDGNGGSARATVTVAVAAVNNAPVAFDDSTITEEGTAVTIRPLLNDNDYDGDPLSIQSASRPDHGTVEIQGDRLVYTPITGFSGVDSFTYVVSDGKGGTSEATVFVGVTPINDPPVPQDDSATTVQGQAVTLSVLANDDDPDGDPVSIVSVSQPSGGSVLIAGSTLIYQPDPDFVGVDTFTYTITDNQGSLSTATVTIGVDPLVAGAGAAAEDAAAREGRVVIHEIAWAGTAADARDEWIELRNVGGTPVDLSGWVLRWRSTHPATPEDQIWKVIELSGTISAAGAAISDEEAGIRVEGTDGLAWRIISEAGDSGSGYYMLERRHDNTIKGLQADLVYDDTGRSLGLELSDAGEIVMLLNAFGEVVDTANASNLGRSGWVAGSASTRGSMERIDPLRADTADNWRTNFGLMIVGRDASDQPLRATPGAANSAAVEASQAVAELSSTFIRIGTPLRIGFSLSRQDRRLTGWPWISVVRPGFAGASGAGGVADATAYAFSGSHENDGRYVLEISTSNLGVGAYSFWIIYGTGTAMYVPVNVSR
jgi:large repetitive protein